MAYPIPDVDIKQNITTSTIIKSYSVEDVLKFSAQIHRQTVEKWALVVVVGITIACFYARLTHTDADMVRFTEETIASIVTALLGFAAGRSGRSGEVN